MFGPSLSALPWRGFLCHNPEVPMGSEGWEDLRTSRVRGRGGASSDRRGRAAGAYCSSYAVSSWRCSGSCSTPGDQSGEVPWCLFRPLYRLPFGLVLKP
ncbi:hypothetical protein PIB30_022786 [Stylosanthes scabra]|uniref:Uncharacterized protein n=1 Tax=Stylosanthes scabra TaxID=79078 RepID=A0ABU6TA30_9FABA|nr:hypothetical protein [Stylosanthes scabra]